MLRSAYLHFCLFILGIAVAHGQIPQGCPPATPTGRATISPYTLSNFNLGKEIDQIVVRNTSTPLVMVVAHRGFWEFVPRNTLEAMQSAWDLGSEGVEMDVRLSGAGTDPANGLDYPNGEVFLTHDYDMRGETPNDPSLSPAQNTNITLKLTPQELRARFMVDRIGNPAVDSSAQHTPLRIGSFTDLLASYVARAQTISGVVSGDSPISGYSLVERGQLLVIDIKGQDTGGGTSVSNQYDIFLECLRELSAYQMQNKIDLRDAIVFKVSITNFINPVGESPVPAATLIANIKALGFPYNPLLIFIVYPQDAANCSQTPCVQIAPPDNKSLNDYLTNYKSLLTMDWQARNPGNALDVYLTSQNPNWAARSAAMFQGSNSFAEGFRQNDGTCFNRGVTEPPNLVDWSACRSDPIIRWGTQALDYLVPSSGTRAGMVTTDLFLNAFSYLNTFGLNNQQLIK